MNEYQDTQLLALEKDRIILLKKISESLEKIANRYDQWPYRVSCDLSKDDKAYGGHLTVVNDDHLDSFKLPD